MSTSTIASSGRKLEWLCAALMAALPLGVAGLWLGADTQALLVMTNMQNLAAGELAFAQRLGGLAVSMLWVSAVVFGLSRLRRLFSLYARGILFSPANIAALNGAGLSFLLYAGAEFLGTPLLSLALTHGNPAGERMIAVGVSSSMIAPVCLGLMVLAIAKVMDEARRINDEHSLTV